jgi:uncharacterized protein YhbP (UPF0306 family)
MRQKGFTLTQHEELNTLAGEIIDSNLYIVLGTADESGHPWVSPVYFASADYTEFYWISSPEARHSRNLAMRPQISIVVFDSQAPVGTGQAVYMLAVARELTGADLERGLVIYNGRFPDPAERGVRTIKPEDVCAPALYRLYRAVASEQWVLDPGAHPDRRTPVRMPVTV